MKQLKQIIPYIFSICIIYFLFVAVFYFVLYSDKNFLVKLFDKFNVYNNLPFKIETSDVYKISNELMNYLIGRSDILNTKININNQLVELYSKTAIIHMTDVRNIFIFNIHLSIISIIVATIFLIFYIKSNFSIYQLFIAYRNTILFLSAFLLFILIYAFIDFNSFFMFFHEIVFTNDYYMFDPSVDFIILMLPEKLFAYIGFKFVMCFLLAVCLLFLALYLFSKTQHRPEAKQRL